MSTLPHHVDVPTHGLIRHEAVPVVIYADARDPKAGGASHLYTLGARDGTEKVFATINYQHGPRNEPGSRPGLMDVHVLAVARDRLLGFQSGPFACRENALALTAIEEAMMWLTRRSDERAARGVLGVNVK